MYAVLLALFIKLPVYGLHLWLPKAHVEAPTGGRMLLAAVILKLGTFGIIMYGGLSLLPPHFFLAWFRAWGAALATVAILFQADLKGLAAYRSIVHMGVATSALFCQSPLGAQAAFLVALGHGVSSSLLFFWVGSVQRAYFSRNLFLVGGVRNLGRGFFLATFIVVFACNGTPPFFSFWGELLSLVCLIGAAGAKILPILIFAGAVCPAAYFVAYFRGVSRFPVLPKTAPLSPLGLFIAWGHIALLTLFFFFRAPVGCIFFC